MSKEQVTISKERVAMSKDSDETPPVIGIFQEVVRLGEVLDLSHEISSSTPVFPFHAPYSLALHRRHGDTVRPGNASFANEVLIMPGHLSTHIDALGHFSKEGLVYGDISAKDIETHDGLNALDISITPPIWRRGVLLDVARLRGVDCMEVGDGIDDEDLAACERATGVTVREDDVVVIRTGWSRHWLDRDRFNGLDGGYPGVTPDGARWLIDRKVAMVASDTPAFEVAPSTGVSVHAMLLVDNAINILENLNLEEVSARRVSQFLFVGLPLRIVGATASPLRPIAVV